jgi:hypothetical protein
MPPELEATTTREDTMNNPFEADDYVWWENELYLVREAIGDRCLVSDVGYETSNTYREWVHFSELELYDGEDEYLNDPEPPDEPMPGED